MRVRLSQLKPGEWGRVADPAYATCKGKLVQRIEPGVTWQLDADDPVLGIGESNNKQGVAWVIDPWVEPVNVEITVSKRELTYGDIQVGKKFVYAAVEYVKVSIMRDGIFRKAGYDELRHTVLEFAEDMIVREPEVQMP